MKSANIWLLVIVCIVMLLLAVLIIKEAKQQSYLSAPVYSRGADASYDHERANCRYPFAR